MRRREFLMMSGGLAGLWARPLRAQAGAPVVGFLNSASPETYAFNAAAFREGLKEAGFVEGQNVRIEYRWANADYQRLPVLAKELVALGVNAIAATGDVASARAAQAATHSIPIVFTIGADPVRFGLVVSMNRPGANVTGISLLSSVLGAKRVELLKRIAPGVTRIALLMNPDNPNAELEQDDAQKGARLLGLESTVYAARNEAEIDAAFAALLQHGDNGFITGTDPILLDRRVQIVALAARHALPGAYFVRQFAASGGLVSYGPSITWMYRQAGSYVGRILKGENPAEMPVLQPTRFELVVNLKTAHTLGLDVPHTILVGADDIIE